jgi:hypothetical protein
MAIRIKHKINEAIGGRQKAAAHRRGCVYRGELDRGFISDIV